jgi:6,7-dimethyl-8-ribityllumazine synthase
MSTNFPKSKATKTPVKARVAVIAARFNEEIVARLLEGCLKQLTKLGIKKVVVHRVPGAFELPLAAKAAAKSKRFDAIICLGAIIRGDTPHFDFVAGEAARGISAVALSEIIPVIFGVLTTNTLRQAVERCGGKNGHAGQRAAEAAVEMIGVLKEIGK